MILNISCFIKTNLYFTILFREHNHNGETMGGNVSRSSIALLVRGTLVTLTNTPLEQHILVSAPPEQHVPGCTHDVGDAEHDPITHFQDRFLGSSCVTSMGTLPITFLVDGDLLPMKLDNLLAI